MRKIILATTMISAMAVTPVVADNKVKDGALFGALLLGGTGVLSDASTSSTIKRAAIGAAAGAAIGYGLEKQEEKTRSRSVTTQQSAPQVTQASQQTPAPVSQVSTATLEDYNQQQDDLHAAMTGTGASVVNNGDHIMVNMPGGLTFDSGSVEPSSEARATLARLAGSLNRYPNSVIDAIGHTDGSGDADANQALSARRAQAVTNVLIQYGVDPTRIRSFGRGEWEPIARNDTEYGKSLNRRVEILVYPQ